jgi:branched-chain amino acid transport system permease protein
MQAFVLALGGTLWIAAVYALMSVGTVVIFRTTRVLNFAGGDVGLIGSYVIATMIGLFSSFWLGIVTGVLIAAVGGALVYVLFMIPLIGRSNAGGIVGPLAMVMSTFVLAILIENIVPLVWGTSSRNVPNPFSNELTLRIGDFGMTSLQIATVVCAVVGIAGFTALLRWTSIGVSMRAVSSSPRLAAGIGINVHAIGALSWASGVFFSSLGALSFALATDLDPTTTASLGVAIFPAIIIGGLDSIPGCLFGALVLALVETIVGLIFGGTWTDVTAYIVLLVILSVRPYGVFGRQSVSRL